MHGETSPIISFPFFLNPNVYRACSGGSLTEVEISALYFSHGKHPGAEAGILRTWNDSKIRASMGYSLMP